jgi:hypothetical protein
MQLFHNNSLEKICLRTGKPAAQADCRIGESLFYDRFDRAVVNTGAAVNADISVDDISLVALSNSLNRAVVSAATALDTSVSNFVCHDFPSRYVIMVHS